MRIVEKIKEECQKPLIIRGFVLVVDALDERGDSRILMNGHPDQRASDSLGLLRLALLVEEEGIRREWFSEEVEED